jgi:uncharacterized protein (TIGR02145 family)
MKVEILFLSSKNKEILLPINILKEKIMSYKTVYLVLLLICCFLLTTCEWKLEKVMEVSTGDIIEIKLNTAKAYGEIIDPGEGVTQIGHCYSKVPDVFLTNTNLITQLTEIPNIGSFKSELNSLDAGTKYYIKAYVTHGKNTEYGEEKEFRTEPATVKDIDENLYNVIQIGTQLWMKENLRTTTYKDKATIPLVTDNSNWAALTTPAYCWYYNDGSTYKASYGALYNWFSAKTGKLCPVGWHVPTDIEWKTLTTFLGGEITAGSKLKEAGFEHWNPYRDYQGGTNTSGFTAFPSGCRGETGTFGSIWYYGYCWSDSESDEIKAWIRGMSYQSDEVGRQANDKRSGLSIRCLRD